MNIHFKNYHINVSLLMPHAYKFVCLKHKPATGNLRVVGHNVYIQFIALFLNSELGSI